MDSSHYRAIHAAVIVLGVFGVARTACVCRGEDQRATTVGMTARIEQLVLPGTLLAVKPVEDRHQPVILRIAAAFPHGTSQRYDLVYYGLEPGTFDLKDYLYRVDGSAMDDLPSLSVEIEPVLPPGQVEPSALTPGANPRLGGYRVLLIGGGIFWTIGLFVILFAGRRGKTAGGTRGAREVSLAERLHETVKRATDGELDRSELAELERILLGYWRKRLQLNEIDAAEAIIQLRHHEEAGPLLRQLEQWLHAPASSIEVDVATLLEPYRDVPADALDGQE